MSQPLRAETATDRADMPHQFTGLLPECEVCQTGVDDQRHRAWQQWKEASRETAAAKPRWELGS